MPSSGKSGQNWRNGVKKILDPAGTKTAKIYYVIPPPGSGTTAKKLPNLEKSSLVLSDACNVLERHEIVGRMDQSKSEDCLKSLSNESD